MNLITPPLLKIVKKQSYIAPSLDIISIGSKLNLLETLSTKSGLENWEIGEEAIDLEDGH